MEMNLIDDGKKTNYDLTNANYLFRVWQINWKYHVYKVVPVFDKILLNKPITKFVFFFHSVCS